MKKTTKLALALLSLIFTIAIVAGIFWGFSKEEVRCFKSPDGRHICVVTRYRYKSIIPRMPGQGSDYSCFLSIYDGNTHCGIIPIPIAWMISDLRWESSSASITAIGKWDFTRKTCYYWSGDQSTQISGL